ncbi:MAG: glycosyltransferase, partial [Cyclobacteriaceae bacterium]|nr:glycosyltransferase [Cyclobacteriaceae bacterium]
MKSNRRIAIWIHGGLGGGYHGQGIPVISNLIQDMAASLDVTVYSMLPANRDYKPTGFEFYSPAQIIRPTFLRWIFLVTKFLFNHLFNRYTILYAFWGYPAGRMVTLLGKLLKLPSVIHLQGGDSVYLPSIQYGSLTPSRRDAIIRSYQQCTRLIALTEFQTEKVRSQDVSRPIDIIPFGVDRSMFQRINKEPLKNRPLRCLHVANLIPVKNQEVLLNIFEALQSMGPCELRIVGLDHLNGQLEASCKRRGIAAKVWFVGQQTQQEVAGHYAWADVLLHTSIYEGQAVVIGEAWASGCLVAGTLVGLLANVGSQA